MKTNHPKIEQLSHFTIERLSDAVFWADPQSRIYRVNAAAIRHLGYSKDELLTMKISDVNPDFMAMDWKQLRKKHTSDEPLIFETRHKRKDGTLVPVEVSVNFIRYEGKEYSCTFARDISGRKADETKLNHALVEVERLKEQLQQENQYLRSEIKREHNFEEIVTRDPSMQEVLHRVRQVAQTSATVLILGETGTGKELLARAVHNSSPRRDRPLIKVNCAALPDNLIESELFGHEKGAFTGAQTRRIGRFELGNGGSLFLDEIGELSMDLQVKLLRVLQEGEFERIGGTKTVQVDTRVIAATNRDLETAMDQGRFREDLFYRLNVFPIVAPPLRKRTEDIPLLVDYFVRKSCAHAGKTIKEIPLETLLKLKTYSWPGNIRELENVVERAVILSAGEVLEIHEGFMLREFTHRRTENEYSLPAMEKQLIQDALVKTNGKIEGEKGAARLLQIAPSTLRDRIRHYGIDRDRIR
jgi:formate hydrogenlyase transcriptional activator